MKMYVGSAISDAVLFYPLKRKGERTLKSGYGYGVDAGTVAATSQLVSCFLVKQTIERSGFVQGALSDFSGVLYRDFVIYHRFRRIRNLLVAEHNDSCDVIKTVLNFSSERSPEKC